MNEEANLLEHLAGKLIAQLKARFANVQSARVRVCKHNPPIKGLCQRAVVTLEG
jgi:dihydroneopterin aldolase